VSITATSPPEKAKQTLILPSSASFPLDQKMIISKQNRKTIYTSLFSQGVLVAPKNFEVQHPELEVPNLQG
jgi:hypothetical protein